MPPLPPVTKYLLWALAIAYLLQSLVGDVVVFRWFALWPWGSYVLGMGADGLPVTVGFQPWQLVTYGLLHGNFFHILFNALVVFQFGGMVEEALGRKRYIQYVLTTLVGAGLLQMLVSTVIDQSSGTLVHTVGASGLTMGLLLAYAYMFPNRRLMLVLPPMEVTSRNLVIGLAAISVFAGVTGTVQGIAHFAHLGGMLFGWLLLRYWGRKPPFGKRQRPRPRLVR